MKKVDIEQELIRLRLTTHNKADDLVKEANLILASDLLTEKKILNNLKHYQNSFDLINEEEVNNDLIFTVSQIKNIALTYRLKFLDSQFYKREIPFEAVLKIKDIDIQQRKNIKGFKILAPIESFKIEKSIFCSILLAPTNLGNYYIIHKWGDPFKWHRKLFSWPLKNFDNLFISILVFTLMVTLSLPTPLITLDTSATYWCGYRAAAFMHLLIFHCGVTAYVTFVLGKNLSSITWNRYKDFG